MGDEIRIEGLKVALSPAVSSFMDVIRSKINTAAFMPGRWKEDGRMYPPFLCDAEDLPERPGMYKLQSRKHASYIGTDGSIEIIRISSVPTLSAAVMISC
jgi:hypothetical protein